MTCIASATHPNGCPGSFTGATALPLAVTDLPAAATGLSLAATGLSLTAAGLSAAAAGLSVVAAGLSAAAAGLSMAAAGLSAAAAGLSAGLAFLQSQPASSNYNFSHLRFNNHTSCSTPQGFVKHSTMKLDDFEHFNFFSCTSPPISI